MSGTPVETLRAVNQQLRAGLVRLQTGCSRPAAVAPGDFAGLLSELLRAPECWREIASGGGVDEELRQEILEYCEHLIQLRKILPLLQGRLLAEKARLQEVRTRVASVEAWAQASKGTL